MNNEEEYELNINDENVDDPLTAQKVLASLETAWSNEMCAPEILHHQSEMLELMLGQISHIEENMKELDKNDLRFIAHQMELERIRYIIASYLRCRIQKIDMFAKHIIMEESLRSTSEKKLSEAESIYAQDYLELIENHFNILALQFMPSIQRSNIDQQIVRPNLMSHVFIKANISVPAVVVGVDDEEVDLAAGSQHIIPYQLVSNLIEKKQAQLI